MKRVPCLEILKDQVQENWLVASTISVNSSVWSRLRPEGPNWLGLNLGLCTPFSLGLALTFPNQKVVALDADGSLMVDASGLITVADAAPKNLTVIVFDNGWYARMGETATARCVDLERMAQGAGFKSTWCVHDLDAFKSATTKAFASDGPHFILAKVEHENIRIMPTRRGAGLAMREAFIDALHRNPEYAKYGEDVQRLPKHQKPEPVTPPRSELEKGRKGQ